METPMVLRPVLRGKHRVDPGTGKMVWEGTWAMRDSELENFPERCPKFRFERTGIYQSEDKTVPSPAHEGLYSGYFELKMGGKKFHERNVLIQFFGEESTPELRVVGSGANRLGKFTLKGSWDRSTEVLQVVREYATVRKKKGSATIVGDEAVGVPAAHGLTTLPPKVALDGPLMFKVMEIVDELMEEDKPRWFCEPVNAAALGLADYHQVIARPMDLGTVSSKFKSEQYGSAQEMRDDIVLTFSNAIHYNPRGHHIYKRAVELEEFFSRRYAEVLRVAEEEDGDDHEPGDSNAVDPDGNSLPISTPYVMKRAGAAPPLRLIGKRHSIPKIIFDPLVSPPVKRQKLAVSSKKEGPGASISQGSSGRKSPLFAGGDATSPRGKETDEISSLRKQVAAMSRQISELSTMMTLESDMLASGDAGVSGQEVPEQLERTRGGKLVTFEQKRRLGRDIGNLPSDKLSRLMEIIEEGGADLPVNASTGEVELDIDSLDNYTIQRLRKYVARHV